MQYFDSKLKDIIFTYLVSFEKKNPHTLTDVHIKELKLYAFDTHNDKENLSH
jgi:Trk K+ transport system NAD-binding subunit